MILEFLKSINRQNTMVKNLLEKEMLDISIENADKIKNKDDFLSKSYRVEEKFDGTKLNIWRNDKNWDKNYEKNWIVSYKNQILYGAEFENVDREKIKKYSVGVSQYAFVHDHLKKIHSKTKSFPKNTEVFVEFIQNKLTTTRDYKNKHGLYLIAYSPATGEVEGGMLKTKPSGFFQEQNEKYATMLGLNLPPVVFAGKLDSVSNIEKGIQNKKLKSTFNTYKHEYDENPYETVKKIFLEFESELGGKTEGVVLHTEDGKIYKFVQDDQHDKTVRFSKKEKYQSSEEIEKEYWNTINTFSKKIIIGMNYDYDSLTYDDILKEYSDRINSLSDNQIKQLFKFKFDAMRDEGKMS